MVKEYLEESLVRTWQGIQQRSLLYPQTALLTSEETANIRQVVYHMYHIIKQAFMTYCTLDNLVWFLRTHLRIIDYCV